MVKPPFTEVRYMTKAVYVPVPGYLKKCELSGEPIIRQYGDDKTGVMCTMAMPGDPDYTLTVEVVVGEDLFGELERLQEYLKFSHVHCEKIPMVVVLDTGDQLSFIGNHVTEAGIINKAEEPERKPKWPLMVERKATFRFKLRSREPVTLL